MPSFPLSVLALVLAPAAFEVPFRLTEDAIVLDAAVNGKKASLLFDTGFGGSVLADVDLGIGPPTGKARLRDFVGKLEAETVQLRSLALGGKPLAQEGMEAIVQPFGAMSDIYGVHLDGLLGLEPFKTKVFEINFERRRLVFHPPTTDLGKRTPDGRRTFLSRMLPIGANSIEVECLAPSGRPMTMTLDTGNAFFATSHKDVLERVGLWEPGRQPRYVGLSAVASGPVDSFYKRVDGARIMGVEVPRSVWNVLDLRSSDAEADGTVGFGFLKRFNVTIDMERRRVWLERFAEFGDGGEVASLGLSAETDGKSRQTVVVRVVPGGPADVAGIVKGDRIVSVDGIVPHELNTRQFATLVEGAAGTPVSLVLVREGRSFPVELRRVPLVND